MRLFLNISLILVALSSHAQYWFGPKVGANYTNHIYQESTYEKDSFNIPRDWNFNAGVAFGYSASSRFEFYGELLFEQIGKKITDKATGGTTVTASMTNNFISIPAMLRINLGKVPFHYYLNGGPRLSYWLSGKGNIYLAEFEEFPPAGVDRNGNALPASYKVSFNRSKALDADDRSVAYLSKPNRVQFGLTAGAGMFFDMRGGGRLQLDFRYTWVHINMGTNNGSNDINFDDISYRENFEYYHGIASVGLAYLLEYNSRLRRRGKSTISESNRRK